MLSGAQAKARPMEYIRLAESRCVMQDGAKPSEDVDACDNGNDEGLRFRNRSTSSG
jgi:hypothetical protein